MRTWVRLLFIRETGKVVHACIKGKGYLPALFKGIVAFAVFYLGVIALVYTG